MAFLGTEQRISCSVLLVFGKSQHDDTVGRLRALFILNKEKQPSLSQECKNVSS